MTALGLAKRSLLLFCFALFWMKKPLVVNGLPAVPADLIFLVASLSWATAVLTGAVKLHWHNGFWPLLTYFAALSVSALFSTDPQTSAFKLATQAYLIAVPVLTYNLVQGWADLRQLFRAYVAGSAIVALLGVGTLLLFPMLDRHSILKWTLHHYGTLPPGPYPRLEITFEYPAMMANYLALALMLVMLGVRLGWLDRRLGWVLGGSIVITALFALTPGFGGLLLMIGLWLWHRNRGTVIGKGALAAGLAAGLLEIPVAAVTPIIYRTAPFLIHAPGLAQPLAPAVRLLCWIDAARTFAGHPLVGVGIGVDPVHVPYVNPVGIFTIVTDAHSMPLSIAAQAGMVGLAGIATIIWYAWRHTVRGGEVVFGLGAAFLTCLVVQGFVGSFEDARHIWLCYGLLLAAMRLAEMDAEKESISTLGA